MGMQLQLSYMAGADVNGTGALENCLVVSYQYSYCRTQQSYFWNYLLMSVGCLGSHKKMQIFREVLCITTKNLETTQQNGQMNK